MSSQQAGGLSAQHLSLSFTIQCPWLSLPSQPDRTFHNFKASNIPNYSIVRICGFANVNCSVGYISPSWADAWFISRGCVIYVCPDQYKMFQWQRGFEKATLYLFDGRYLTEQFTICKSQNSATVAFYVVRKR